MVSSVAGKSVTACLRRCRFALLAVGAAVSLAIPAAASAAVGPEVTSTVTVGTAPLGVAANPSTNTIYVANAASNTVSVINGRANEVTATIPVGAAPHGVAADWVTNT